MVLKMVKAAGCPHLLGTKGYRPPALVRGKETRRLCQTAAHLFKEPERVLHVVCTVGHACVKHLCNLAVRPMHKDLAGVLANVWGGWRIGTGERWAEMADSRGAVG